MYKFITRDKRDLAYMYTISRHYSPKDISYDTYSDIFLYLYELLNYNNNIM